MTTAVIVQARIGSTRLPAKVLEQIGGRTVLAHVLSRCKEIPEVDRVVCAVPDKAESEPLEAQARACDVNVFRGSESDVLARYYGAARAVRANVVMRVTSDCPLIDPDVCGNVLALRRASQADYAANNMPRSFPHGLDCEAFTAEALAQAFEQATEADDREHVTPWLRRAPHLRRVNLESGDRTLTRFRWTLDYPEDLEFFRAVFEALPAGSNGRMSDVVRLLRSRPEIAAINRARHREGPAQ